MDKSVETTIYGGAVSELPMQHVFFYCSKFYKHLQCLESTLNLYRGSRMQEVVNRHAAHAC